MTGFICCCFKPSEVMSTTVNKSVYTPEWANKLYRGVARNFHAPFTFTCITDFPANDFVTGVKVATFVKREHKGTWMSLNEVLRPDLELDNAVMMGLDTVILNDITGLAEHGSKFALLRPPVASVTAWNPVALYKSPGWLWDAYTENMEAADRISRYTGWARHQGSELLYWAKMVPDHEFIQDVCPDVDIRSYKHERELCPKADICYFQGSYKPDTAEEGWVKRNWG